MSKPKGACETNDLWRTIKLKDEMRVLINEIHQLLLKQDHVNIQIKIDLKGSWFESIGTSRTRV